MTERLTRSQTMTDPLDPARAAALQATLGGAPTIGPGDPLPPFFHQVYFWEALPPEALGRDGHPRLGDFIPDLGLPRRMWAAGRLAFHRPLLAGARATRDSRVEAVTRKTGRSGPLAFVRVRHDIRQRGSLCITEWQELVYREDAGPGARPATPPEAPRDEAEAMPVAFDRTMLFRYSALTFNGHRIHYDETYARAVEGHGGLVVHGPLLAQLLMLLAADRLGRLDRFTYRATAPLLVDETAELCRAEGGRLWVRGPGGRLCMEAEAG